MSLKILHLETGRHLYGGALQVCYLLRGLSDLGVDNVLVCRKGSAISTAAAGFASRVHTLPIFGDLDLRLMPWLRRIIRAEHPDLVHLHNRGVDVIGAVAARREHVPSVLTRRNDNPEPAWWARRKYRLFDRVVAISRGVRDVLVAEGVPAEDIECIHSVVDCDRFRPGCERDGFVSEFRIGPGEKVIGMTAQLIPRKGHRYLLAAAPAILKEFPNTRFLLFGRGRLESEIRAGIERQGLSAHVQLIGFREDIERLLPCFDLLVHPADMEGLGVSLLQASASGVPIVASAVGGIPDAVHDNENGLLIPPADPAALTAAVCALLRDPDRARRLGAAGRALVERQFSITGMASGYRALYERLAVQAHDA